MRTTETTDTGPAAWPTRGRGETRQATQETSPPRPQVVPHVVDPIPAVGTSDLHQDRIQPGGRRSSPARRLVVFRGSVFMRQGSPRRRFITAICASGRQPRGARCTQELASGPRHPRGVDLTWERPRYIFDHTIFRTLVSSTSGADGKTPTRAVREAERNEPRRRSIATARSPTLRPSPVHGNVTGGLV